MAETGLLTGLVTRTIDAEYADGVLRPMERLDLAEHQQVTLYVLPPRVRVPAIVARRKVNVFVCNEISCLMGSGAPELVRGERVFWRVPVLLTFPGHGAIGTVGAIDVDAETGDLLTTPSLTEEITRNAKVFAARLPPEAATEG